MSPTTDPTIIELRLMTTFEGPVETFITTDPNAAEHKKREWRDDRWNRTLEISQRTWENGEVISETDEVIY